MTSHFSIRKLQDLKHIPTLHSGGPFQDAVECWKFCNLFLTEEKKHGGRLIWFRVYAERLKVVTNLRKSHVCRLFKSFAMICI